MSESFPTVRVERVDGVALVTIDRPSARNAIDAATATALGIVVEQTEANPDIMAVVLTGSGDVFCSGADLKSVARGELGSLYTPAGGFAGFVSAKRAKPWIAAVNGLALAGGCEIALACDMIVASEDAAFGLPALTGVPALTRRHSRFAPCRIPAGRNPSRTWRSCAVRATPVSGASFIISFASMRLQAARCWVLLKDRSGSLTITSFSLCPPVS